MSLTPEHVEILRVRGISAAFAEAHGLRSVDAAEANRILGRTGKRALTCGGLAIPYPGTDLVVIRPDVPPKNDDGEPLKYVSPDDSAVRVYVPNEKRERFLADPAMPALAAEGPLKALALAEAGFAAAGILSCSCWGRKRTPEEKAAGVPRELHPDLLALPLGGHPNVTMLDSDAITKCGIADEERAFASALLRTHLDARIGRVPHLRGLDKAGIDDWLAKLPESERRPFVDRLIAEARRPEDMPVLSPAAALLNRFETLIANATPEGGNLDEVGVEAAIRKLEPFVEKARIDKRHPLDDLGVKTLREGLRRRLSALGLKSAGTFADSVAGRGSGIAEEKLQGKPVLFEKLEPWPEPVEGAAVLDEIEGFLEKYVVLPAHGAVAVALWCLATHVLDAFSIFARLAFTSATKQCGKSNTLRLVEALVPRPLTASNASAASIYRVIAKHCPTLCLDELETTLTGNEELRGILNSSHERRGAFVLRCVGEGAEVDVAQFSTWAAIAVACIGKLPGTLEDRSIEVRMCRKTKAEKVSLLRTDRIGDEAKDLRRKATRWAADYLRSLREADPDVPRALGNRAADNWRPLLAVADLAGGRWSALARAAAGALSGGDGTAADGPGVELLRDIRSVFAERCEPERITTEDLLKALIALEERPWRTWRRGSPLDPRALAKLLGAFGVRSRDIRTPERSGPLKGYLCADFGDAWSRYFPEPSAEKPTPASSSPPEGGSESATTRQAGILAGSCGIVIRDNGNPVADPNCPGRLEKTGLSRCRGLETPPRVGSGVVADPLAVEEGVE